MVVLKESYQRRKFLQKRSCRADVDAVAMLTKAMR